MSRTPPPDAGGGEPRRESTRVYHSHFLSLETLIYMCVNIYIRVKAETEGAEEERTVRTCSALYSSLPPPARGGHATTYRYLARQITRARGCRVTSPVDTALTDHCPQTVGPAGAHSVTAQFECWPAPPGTCAQQGAHPAPALRLRMSGKQVGRTSLLRSLRAPQQRTDAA